MHLHFLEGPSPLTKAYEHTPNGLIKTPYPFIWEFTSHPEDVKGLAQLEALLKSHAALGHCLLKGQLARPLVKESRAGTTNTNQETELVVLDLDGLPMKSVDAFLDALGLGDISYVVQWSASYSIENKDLRCHVFMLLDKPMAAPLLKQWLIQLNHTVPQLHDAMSLTKTGMAIKWPLDISACQNDKLIYIAPPLLKGIKDPVPKGKRIALVKKAKDKLSIASTVNSTDKNKELTHKRIATLREAAGLPSRKYTYKVHGTTEVMNKPDASVVTEMKVERGFVYFNLNGGDSWAYYHPENNPDYIFNFKGECAYLTKELLPDYWAQISSQPKVSSSGELYLVFCDRNTGVYWRGTYNQQTDLLEIRPAKNETQVRAFAKQYGVPLGDYIPEWDLSFDPNDNVRVDAQNLSINTFQPSPYMLAVGKRPVKAIPPTIWKVMHHALGGVPEITEHFVNWLSYIIQHRDKATTMWVLHGVPGTGKGQLMNRILRPLLGPPQCSTIHMEQLAEPYNHWMKGALLCFVDEVQTKALANESMVLAKLKTWSAEPMIPIREMYAGSVERRNYCSFIFFSNMPDPVHIPRNDRRFNVGRYQPDELQITDQELDAIKGELQEFYNYLYHYKVDRQAVLKPLNTADRNQLLSISESSADAVADALLTGNFEFFVDQLPTDQNYTADARSFNRVENYKRALSEVLASTHPATGKCAIARDTLYILFDYCVGNMPDTPNKFTSFLKHHRVYITKVWHQATTVNGIKVEFKDIAQWPEYKTQINPPPKPSASPKKLARVV